MICDLFCLWVFITLCSLLCVGVLELIVELIIRTHQYIMKQWDEYHAQREIDRMHQDNSMIRMLGCIGCLYRHHYIREIEADCINMCMHGRIARIFTRDCGCNDTPVFSSKRIEPL